MGFPTTLPTLQPVQPATFLQGQGQSRGTTRLIPSDEPLAFGIVAPHTRDPTVDDLALVVFFSQGIKVSLDVSFVPRLSFGLQPLGRLGPAAVGWYLSSSVAASLCTCSHIDCMSHHPLSILTAFPPHRQTFLETHILASRAYFTP